jgi:uncharacterized protein with von Willebrand factor type A (vWA) domain
MNERLKDILTHLNSEVDQDTLLRYLEGKLTPEKQQELEAQLLDTDFEAEALEGLQQLPNKSAIPDIVAGLNRDLRKKTARRRPRRLKADARLEPWLLITLITVLLLIVISFVIIWRLKHPK